jgi:ring-1,2-phenylacetyl-CoA epoxidase subunit PaaD
VNETTQAQLDAVEAAVRAALETVPDPEIPACSVLDLGMLHRIHADDRSVEVTLLPTFAGCPALDAIQHDARHAIQRALPGLDVTVKFTFEIPWTTDRISAAAREQMQSLGIAPPRTDGLVLIDLGRPSAAGPCPYCSSEETEGSSAFGPTPCRSVAYCNSCRNPFEVFKPKG